VVEEPSVRPTSFLDLFASSKLAKHQHRLINQAFAPWMGRNGAHTLDASRSATIGQETCFETKSGEKYPSDAGNHPNCAKMRRECIRDTDRITV